MNAQASQLIGAYRYFREPHAFATFSAAAKRCDICHSAASGYDGSFSGTSDVLFVCEPCLYRGRLQEFDCTTNDGDLEKLRANLRSSNVPSERLAAIVEERAAELVYRTPSVATWQPLIWPVHCTDFCRFEKEAGRADFVRLASAHDAKSFFIGHLYPGYGNTNIDEVWLSLREDSPASNEIAYDTASYLFSCTVCSAPVVTWDCS